MQIKAFYRALIFFDIVDLFLRERVRQYVSQYGKADGWRVGGLAY